MPQPKRFGIYAKNYFITYPHCALSLEQALSQLKNLNTPPVNKKFIRVSREKHDDGDYHLDVLIQFEGKYGCTNPRFFDLVSPSRPAHYHPNIQGAKSSSDVKSYIEKDGGEFLDWGEIQIDGTSSRGGGQQLLPKVCASALNANSKTEALQIIKEKHPMYYILQLHNLDSKLDKIFTKPPATFVPQWNPSSFRIPDNWQQWVSKNIVNDAAARRPDRPKSIIIEGPSRVGKTEWARSLGPHNYLSGFLDLNSNVYRNDVSYNVIDHVAPKDLAKKHWKELIGSHRDWQSKCKYSRKPVQIKGGIPSIVLCNPGPDSSYKEFLDEKKNLSLKNWTLQNAEFYFIDNPIFSTEPEGLIHEKRPTRV